MAEKQYTRQAQEALNMARKIAAELEASICWDRTSSFGLKRVLPELQGRCLIRIKSMKNRWKSNGYPCICS